MERLPTDTPASIAPKVQQLVRIGMVHAVSVESNDSFEVVIRKRFAGMDKVVELEAIIYVQPDGKVVIATFGGSKAKDQK